MTCVQALLGELLTTNADGDLQLYFDRIKQVILSPESGESDDVGTNLNTQPFVPNSNSDIVSTCWQLWNTLVTKKSQFAPTANANGRFLVVKLLAENNDNRRLVKSPQLQKMGLLTVRCLLDCGQLERAEESLRLVSDLMEKHKSEFNDSKCQTMARDFHSNMFIVDVYWAEVYVKTSRSEDALSMVRRASNFVVDLDHQLYLARLCYNFGLDAFERGCFEESVSWLRLSFDCGKSDGNQVDVSKTLSLLAEVYLKWDAMLHWEKAKQALELLEKYGSNNAFLMLRCMLSGNVQIGELEAAVRNCVFMDETSDQERYRVLGLLLEHGRTMVAATVMPHFEATGNPSNKGQFILFYTKSLLSKGKVEDAKLLLQQFCSVDKEIKADSKYAKKLCLLTVQQAMELQSAKKYSSALDWYKCSSHFLEFSPDINTFATIARNKCFCLLQEKNVLLASKELQQLKDSGCVHESVDWYLNFKVSVLGGDFTNALVAFQELDKHEAVEMLCIAAQDILATGDTKCILTILEKLCSTPHALIRLVSSKLLLHVYLMTSNDISNEILCTLTTYLNLAYEALSQCTKEETVQNFDMKDEAKWLGKVAWNLALMNSGKICETHTLFALSSRFLAFCPNDDPSAVVFRQMVLMMVAASGLTCARTSEKCMRHSFYEKVLEAVEECECMVNQQLEKENSSHLSKTISSTSFGKLLLLYKFEANAQLDNNDNAEKVFQELVALPQTDANVFERMTAVAKSCGAKYIGISMRALKTAISRRLETDNPDSNKIGQLYRSLIKIALEKFDVKNMSSDEDGWTFVKEATDLICGSEFVYPELEVLWLVCKAWNVGVEFLISNRRKEATRWLEIASQIAKVLPDSVADYKDKIAKVLNEINNV